jgi:hypothetical protein
MSRVASFCHGAHLGERTHGLLGQPVVVRLGLFLRRPEVEAWEEKAHGVEEELCLLRLRRRQLRRVARRLFVEAETHQHERAGEEELRRAGRDEQRCIDVIERRAGQALLVEHHRQLPQHGRGRRPVHQGHREARQLVTGLFGQRLDGLGAHRARAHCERLEERRGRLCGGGPGQKAQPFGDGARVEARLGQPHPRLGAAAHVGEGLEARRGGERRRVAVLDGAQHGAGRIEQRPGATRLAGGEGAPLPALGVAGAQLPLVGFGHPAGPGGDGLGAFRGATQEAWCLLQRQATGVSFGGPPGGGRAP